MFLKPKIKTNVKDKCISFQGIKLQNNLENIFKNANTIYIFAR